ncbi:RhuM family protein, partial [Algoriphagus antarcticus]
ELDEAVVVRKFRTTTQHGAIPDKTQERDVNGYNLDVIISVGYRVKSVSGYAFPYLGYPAFKGVHHQRLYAE